MVMSVSLFPSLPSNTLWGVPPSPYPALPPLPCTHSRVEHGCHVVGDDGVDVEDIGMPPRAHEVDPVGLHLGGLAALALNHVHLGKGGGGEEIEGRGAFVQRVSIQANAEY